MHWRKMVTGWIEWSTWSLFRTGSRDIGKMFVLTVSSTDEKADTFSENNAETKEVERCTLRE